MAKRPDGSRLGAAMPLGRDDKGVFPLPGNIDAVVRSDDKQGISDSESDQDSNRSPNPFH
jgi:hypothetical protein